MSESLWLDNLAAYSLQVSVLVLAGSLLLAALRVRAPKVALGVWQILLLVCCLLPLLQPWEPMGAGKAAVTLATRASGAALPDGGGFDSEQVLAFLLAAGVAARWWWLGLGILRLGRYRQSARKLRRVPAELAAVAARLGANAEVYLSREVDGPVTFGFWRPAVLLPERFVGMERRVQVALLAHELFHVRRRDWVCAVGEEWIRGLLWFHPAAWWLVDRIQLAREQVVDGEVIAFTRARQPYLEALLEVARVRVQATVAPAPLFLRKHHLKQRVALVIEHARARPGRWIVSLALIAGLLTVAGWWAREWFPLRWPGAQKVYRVSDGDVTAPRLTHKVEPDYSDEARDAKLQGTVVIGVEVGPDGRAHNLRVMKRLGMGLEEKALEAIRQWRFVPGKKDGKPVSVGATIEVKFRLLEDAPEAGEGETDGGGEA